MGTRFCGVWGELVDHVFSEHSFRVLHLPSVFAYFWGDAKSKPSGAFKKYTIILALNTYLGYNFL